VKKSEWERIARARDVLQLGDRATFGQIKAAYRRIAKDLHPDVRRNLEVQDSGAAMTEVNAAYRILTDYCARYSFPLTPAEDNRPLDAEDWWMDRFGQAPVWDGAGGHRRK